MPDRDPAFRSRGAVVKARVVRFGPRGMQAARTYLSYVRRGAVTREGECGVLYSAQEDVADGRAFLEGCTDDRHHFRLVARADDSAEYEDLKPLIRRFMRRMEDDLGTRLEWVAADHLNTKRPHTHLLLRGKDDLGENLVIAPRYMNGGMTERLRGIVSIDLGPKNEPEIERGLRLEMAAERVTSTDRQLTASMDSTRIVRAGGRDMLEHSIRTGRLRKLESLGLAEELERGRWHLSEQLEPVLRAISDRTEMLKTIEQVLSGAGLERPHADRLVYRSQDGTVAIGRVLSCVPAEGVDDQGYMVIDGIDGRSHYVAIRGDGSIEPLAVGAIVRIASGQSRGCKNNDPQRTLVSDVIVDLLSAVPLHRLPDYDAATWLDRALGNPEVQPRDAGFGREVRKALAMRRLWLVEQGFAWGDEASVTCRPDMIPTLERRELARVARAISQETGLDVVDACDGSRVEGIIRRRLNLASGPFAIVANEREFSLVRWEREFERAIGRQVNGVVRSDGGISWTISRQRGVEI